MRKLVLALGLVLIAGVASAQETYSIPATANQVTDLTEIVTASNEKTCTRLGQALTCTQAQACTAAGAAGGASCTAAQARAANARIFPLTQAGREEFVQFVVAFPRFADLRAVPVAWQKERFCVLWNAANATTRNNTCTAIGLPSGCRLCSP